MGKWAKETCAWCPQQRYATGEPGKSQGRDRVGIVEGSCGTGPAGSVFGGNAFYRETWGTRLGGGGCHVAKRSSDPRVTYLEVKVQVRDLMRVVGIVAPFTPQGVGSWGKSVYRAPEGQMGTGDVCRVPPAVVRHERARQSSGTWPCGDCRRVLWVPGPGGQCSEKIRLIEKPGAQDKGVAMWLVLTRG